MFSCKFWAVWDPAQPVHWSSLIIERMLDSGSGYPVFIIHCSSVSWLTWGLSFCQRSSYQCPSMFCDTPMVHHIRRFVHGQGCVQIILKELDSPVPGYQHTILTYSWCRICKQVNVYCGYNSLHNKYHLYLYSGSSFLGGE